MNSAWYRELSKLADTKSNTLNIEILQNTLDLIDRSKIPAIIYLAPISPTLKEDRDALEQYEAIKKRLAQFTETYGKGRIKIMSDIPAQALNDIVFVENDDIHLSNEGNLDHYLAQEILQHLEQAQ